MRRHILGSLSIILFLVGCTGASPPVAPYAPPVGFVDALRLVAEAKTAEQRSYKEALARYTEALAKADEITRDNSQSSEALGLLQGTRRIGTYTLAELRDQVVPTMTQYAAAESNLLLASQALVEAIPWPDNQRFGLQWNIEQFLRAGRVAEAVAMAEAMVLIDDPQLRDDKEQAERDEKLARAFEAFADVAIPVDVGPLNAAYELANRMEFPEHKAVALAAIAVPYGQMGQSGKARQLIGEAEETLEEIQKEDTRKWRAEDVAALAGKARVYDATLRLLREHGDMLIHHAIKEAAMTAIAAGDFDQAFALATDKLLDDADDEILVNLAARATEQGPSEFAQRAIGLLGSRPIVQIDLAVQLAGAYRALGDASAAQEQLQKAEELLPRLTNPEISPRMRVGQLTIIVNHYASAGFPERATPALTGLRQALQDLLREDPKEYSYDADEAVEAFAAVGQAEEAWSLALTIAEDLWRRRAQAQAIRAFRATNQHDRAMELLGQMVQEASAGVDASGNLSYIAVESGYTGDLQDPDIRAMLHALIAKTRS